jgi:hypothetical protein
MNARRSVITYQDGDDRDWWTGEEWSTFLDRAQVYPSERAADLARFEQLVDDPNFWRCVLRPIAA